MGRKAVSACVAVLLGLTLLSGCGSSSGAGGAQDNKQPQLVNPPDPKVKGPAVPSGGAKPGEIK